MYIETKHLHRYQTNAEFEAVYRGSGYTEPWVGYVDETSGTSYNKQPVHVTVRLYAYDGTSVDEYENMTQTEWQNIVSGTPVETIEFNSLDEFSNYHFLRTSQDPYMYIIFGNCYRLYNSDTQDYTYFIFRNSMQNIPIEDAYFYRVSMSGYEVSYLSLSDYQGYMPNSVKQLILDYVTEHGSIDVIYASYDYGG